MTARWVCLLYHDVAPVGHGVTGGPEYFSVSETGFRRQLDAIAHEGLRGCSIEHALVTSEPKVAISFDDGTAGMYERAFPALVERGMSATFFITTTWVGTSGFVTWDQLREMKRAGMSIQSHTRTHPFLSELSAAQLGVELRGSKEEIDGQLGQDTRQIGLPGGDAPRGKLADLIGEAGYSVVGTSRWGVNRTVVGHDPVRIRRCTVRADPGEERFRRIITGDRWLAFERRSREFVLRSMRDALGPTRYARWRRRVLDASGGDSERGARRGG